MYTFAPKDIDAIVSAVMREECDVKLKRNGSGFELIIRSNERCRDDVELMVRTFCKNATGHIHLLQYADRRG